MLRKVFFPLCLVFMFRALPAQQTPPAQPKLIVGIVVDQMRYDFLYRYQAKYTSGGFKRLLSEGFTCEDLRYNYVPTYTAPGHSAIYSGATPSVNGIVGNDWWDPEWGEHRYVTTDKRYRPVGTANNKAGQHSPSVLLSTTITDELRLSNNFQSKVVGVCLKDRASILPAGHIPNACYWFDDSTGNWITSSYYPDSAGLPAWVESFNARRLPAKYLSMPWATDSSLQYNESFAGWDRYNKGKYGKFTGSMPYNLPEMYKTQGFGVIRFTPMGSTLTTDFALEAIDKMGLGLDAYPDFLCLSYSSTDYCAHQFGIHGEETEDVYIKLDRDLNRILDFLDKKFGKDNVLVFLTADHGGGETPVHMNDLRIPAGVFEESKLEANLENFLAVQLGTTGDFIHDVSNQQIWLNWEAIADLDLNPEDLAHNIIDYLRAQKGVYDAFTRDEVMTYPIEFPYASETRRGLHPRRSGDVLFQLDPGWHSDDNLFKLGGATHGSPYAYDTHVPLLWYGWKVPQGVSYAPWNITDIAPTLSAMLRIARPSGAAGVVIEPVLKKS
ncbi:MAG: alkaline phosphatase family protein [Saprospiraceae bacterium]|nr:alkaline phosphatase family protein [Saprospiraceae bacterium]